MPELPEVETVRADLARLLAGRRIARVAVRTPKLVQGIGAVAFARRLRGLTVKDVRRRGKLLIFTFADPSVFLLIHMKMTGQLIFRGRRQLAGGGHGYPVVQAQDLPHRYTHLIFSFHGEAALYFNDMRQFGYARLMDEQGLERALAAFGVEPLSRAFTPAALHLQLRRRRAELKSALLDQSVVAGLGNIYTDEACFAAGVRPTRRAERVTRAEAAALQRSIQRVLKRAIAARGTTFGSFRDGLGGAGKFVAQLNVYGRAGQPCRRCGTVLKRVVVGGRGTVYCPVCQR